jgi:Predicted membrane protein
MFGIPLLTILAAYGGTAIVFFGLDLLWLTVLGIGFYRAEIGHLLLDSPNLVPAGVFYLFYIAGLVGFAVLPAANAQSWVWALVAGVALGLLAYGTYDMTNLSTLKGWSLKISIIDLVWGGFLSGTAALAGYFAVSLTR